MFQLPKKLLKMTVQNKKHLTWSSNKLILKSIKYKEEDYGKKFKEK